MPPKEKKGKGKKGSKGKGEEDQKLITEVERELFTIQIADLIAKVERLKARCIELEASNLEYEKNYQQLEEDRADVVAYMKLNAEKKQEEIEELEERIEGIIKARENDVTMYREKIAQNEHDFKIMFEQLTSEIKLLNGKLNSLEEFRLQRDDLIKKYKEQEAGMQEQEERHKQMIYEVERKFILEKDKLKKEMEAKLLQLSKEFTDATEFRVAATTHHAIRENIAINNELDLMLATHKRLTAENEQMRSENQESLMKLRLCERENHELLKKSAVQIKFINRLVDEQGVLDEKIGALENRVGRIADLEKNLKATKLKLEKTMQAVTLAIQERDGCMYEQILLKKNAVDYQQRSLKLKAVINACVEAINEVIIVKKGEDPVYVETRRVTLLSRLLQLMDESTIRYIQIDPADKGSEGDIPPYEEGDLGLVRKTEADSDDTSSKRDSLGSRGSRASQGSRGSKGSAGSKVSHGSLVSKSSREEAMEARKSRTTGVKSTATITQQSRRSTLGDLRRKSVVVEELKEDEEEEVKSEGAEDKEEEEDED